VETEFFGWLKEEVDQLEIDDSEAVIVENWTDPNDDWQEDDN